MNKQITGRLKLVTLAIGLSALASIPAHATSLDLTAGGSGTINGGFFITSNEASTGTGVIDSFVRVQDNGVADGYNADARPVMADVNTSPTFTHDLTLSAVPVVVNPGTKIGSYYEFLLDINQTAANPLLSLDKIDIYTRSTALSSASLLSDLTGSSTLRYSLDTGVDSEILLNYSLNNGSGSGDLFMYIPTSFFGPTTDFVYLYSMFGSKAGYTENDGFEEWAVRKGDTPPPSVPDSGATALMVCGALLMLGAVRSRITA